MLKDIEKEPRTAAIGGIGVVIATYNERHALPLAIERLIDLPHIAQVVVVDASDDQVSRQVARQFGSEENIAKWDGRMVLIEATTAGRAAQMNAGAAQILSDTLLFLHVDTELPTGATQEIVQSIDSGSGWGRFDVRIDDPHWAFRVIETAMNLRSAATGICTGDQSIFVKKTLFDQVNGFRALSLMEDIDISARLKKHTRPARLKARVSTSSRRWRQHGIFRTMCLMWLLRLGFWLGVPAARLATWYRQSNDSTVKH